MPARTLLAFLCAVTLCAAPSAQTSEPVDQRAVDAWLESGEALLLQQKGNQALPLFERALTGAAQLGLERQQAQAHTAIGEVFYYTARYPSSREHATQGLEWYQRAGDNAGIARSSLILSMVEELSGNLPAARAHAQRAIVAYAASGNRRDRAVSTLQLLRVTGIAMSEQRKLYDQVIEDARAIGDAGIEARAWQSLGDHVFAEGQYEEALAHLTRAAALVETLNDPLTLGTLHNSLGRVYRAHGRLDEALRNQLEALALHEKAGVPFPLIQSLNAVATIYQRIGDLAKARTYYERSLALAEKSGSPRVQDLVRGNLATLLMDTGQFGRAATILEQVIANGADVYSARRYSSLSYAYLKLARFQDAFDAATKSVARCAGDEDTCVDAYARRATTNAALGQPQAALGDVNVALATVEAARERLVPLDFFKQEYHHAQEDLYSLAIGLQVREKQDRLALETAELARSRAFLDLLASRDVRFKEKDQERLASLRESPPQLPGLGLQPTPRPQSIALTLRGGDATATVPRTDTAPGALELRSLVAASPSGADDLAATAARLHSTLLVYWVGEDELFIWVVKPDGAVSSKRVPVLRSRLRELIRATSPFAETGSSTKAVASTVVTRGSGQVTLQGGPEAWRELYTILVEPIRAALPRQTGSLITIVPQGVLLNVSFAALQSPSGRYLLEDYTLHYAPAGAVLQFTAPKRRADARTGPMLLVADPVLPRLSSLDEPLPRLPGARNEAAAIAKLIPASQLTVLEDSKASEARARESVSGKAVLHFATHAIVRDEDPFGSFLALGPSSDAKNGDGLLTSEEVYGLDLNADLVVLSACRSAGGRVTGDGISAFARAFIYAGTASLVASLWDVADEPTNRLLPDFYRAWRGGASKASALRGAQLRLLRDLRAGRVHVDTQVGTVTIPEHPVFWAGFALFGEPD